MKKYLPHLSILTAAACWGVLGLFSRRLLAAGLTPRDIVLVRNFGGLLAMTALFLIIDRSVFRIKIRHLPWFFGTGVVSVILFTLMYFSAQQYCSLAIGAVLLYTAPAFVVVMSFLLWKDPITRQKLTALALALLGCAAVSGVFSGGLTATPRGLLLALGSGFFYATYSIFGRFALAHYKNLTVTYWTFVFAGLGALPLTDPVRAAALVFSGAETAFLAAGMVVISTVLAYILYTAGLEKVDSGRASILASIEPVVAAFVGILAFGEPLTASVILGLGCILACVYMLR